MTRSLICAPRGGMGNRMLSILSCLVAAKQTNRSVLVVWPNELPDAMALRLHHLWKYTGFVACTQEDARKQTERADKHFGLQQSQRGPEFSIAGSQSCVHVHGHGFIACKECSDRLQLKPTFERHFELADELQVTVDKIKKDHFRQRTIIAAYVRAGAVSHYKTKEWGPERHFAKLAATILSRPKTNIFVACDCPIAAGRIRQEFPDDRVIIPEVPKMDTPRGWKQAAVNAHLCFAADKFYGSRKSVWTHWVGLLRGDAKSKFLDEV